MPTETDDTHYHALKADVKAYHRHTHSGGGRWHTHGSPHELPNGWEPNDQPEPSGSS